MTYATRANESGAEPWSWVEIEVDRCVLTWGILPCPASTGTKCLNSWETCPAVARPEFDPQPFWIRFCEPRLNIPLNFVFDDAGLPFFLPFLSRVTHSPARLDPGRSMGVRAEAQFDLRDAPHHDIGLDKYRAERGFDAMDRGLFLQRLRARWPWMVGKRARWYEGYLPERETLVSGTIRVGAEGFVWVEGEVETGGTVDVSGDIQLGEATTPAGATLLDFQRRDYVIEAWDGPGSDARVRIKAKDPLKLADDQRAQDPLPTSGVLAFDLAEETDPVTLQVSISSLAEAQKYPLDPGYFFINGEGFTYSYWLYFENDGAPFMWFYDIERVLPGNYVTERTSHDAGDAVQAGSYRTGRAVDIIRDLLTERVPEFRAEWVDHAAWVEEYDTWLGGFEIARMIAEPEGVRKLIDEIITQTLTFSIWFDEEANLVKYRPIRPTDTGEVVATLSDSKSILSGSFRMKEKPDDLVNEIVLLYGQRDPTEKKDETSNYARGYVAIDGDSQSANEVGGRRSERIFARWLGYGSDSRAAQVANRTLDSRTRLPITLEFDLLAKDKLFPAEFADLTTMYLVDALGTTRPDVRIQITRAVYGEEAFSYEAREDFFKGRFRRIAPGSLDGLHWLAATETQRDRYAFASNADGLMADGEPGTQLL